MLTLNPEQIWQAFLRSEFTLAQDPNTLAVMEPFVKSLPVVLSSYIDNFVCLRSLLKSRIAYHEHTLAHGLPKELAENGPSTLMGKEREIALVIETAIIEDRTILDHLCEFLDSEGISEEEYVIERFGLTDSLADRFLAVSLTIGEIICYEPIIIARHT